MKAFNITYIVTALPLPTLLERLGTTGKIDR
jgi:hypothetical protein